jgi:hypothetical protein
MQIFEYKGESLSKVESRGKTVLSSLIEEIAKNYTVTSVSEIRCSFFMIDGREGCTAEAIVKFDLGEDLRNIETEIETLGGHVEKKETPQFYTVQLVDTVQDIGEMQQTVTDKLEYVVGVYRYPDK